MRAPVHTQQDGGGVLAAGARACGSGLPCDLPSWVSSLFLFFLFFPLGFPDLSMTRVNLFRKQPAILESQIGRRDRRQPHTSCSVGLGCYSASVGLEWSLRCERVQTETPTGLSWARCCAAQVRRVTSHPPWLTVTSGGSQSPVSAEARNQRWE